MYRTSDDEARATEHLSVCRFISTLPIPTGLEPAFAHPYIQNCSRLQESVSLAEQDVESWAFNGSLNVLIICVVHKTATPAIT